MSGNTEVIREFLVSLGFRTNKSEQKNFQQTLSSLTKDVLGLGTELEALAAGASVAMTKVASNFEDMFFASQRLNSTVTNIRGTSFAIQQMGGTAAGARGTLEALANFMRSNPAGEKFIANLGVSTRDANGELKDTSAILAQLGQKFRAMPYYAAKVRANFLGIDENTLQALMRGDLERKMDDYRAIVARVGIDQEGGAKAAHDFMMSVRTLGTYVQLVGEKFLLIMTGPAGRVLKFIDDLDKSTGGASTAIAGLLAVLVPLAAIVGPVAVGVGALVVGLGLLIDDFATWKEGGKSLIDWSAWSDEIDSALSGFGDIKDAIIDIGETVGSWLPKQWEEGFGKGAMALVHYFVNAFVMDIHGIADALRVVGSLLKGDWKGALQASKDFVNDSASAVAGQAPGGKPVSFADAKAAAQEQQRKALAAAHGGAGGAGVGVARNAQAVMQYFQSLGWSKAAAAGIASSGVTESGLDPNAVGDHGNAYGAFQWHKDRQDAFKAWTGRDIHGSSLADQLAFAHHELTGGAERKAGVHLANARNAREAGAIMSSEYERPADKLGNMAARGALATSLYDKASLGTAGAGSGGGASGADGSGNVVHINQKTDIHVAGNDAREIGASVAGEQDSVNSNLLRNTRGALR